MSTPIAPIERPRPGQGRLNLVAGYFRILSGAAGIVAVGAAVTALLPQLGWHTTPANPWIAAAGAAVMGFGFHRTAQALHERRRSGAIAALITLGATLTPVLSGSAVGLLSAGISAIGIAALVSAWRHLD
jgi:hypothetical protein